MSVARGVADVLTAIERFVREQQVPLITFTKGQRKDDIAAEHRAAFTGEEGVLFVGIQGDGAPPGLHGAEEYLISKVLQQLSDLLEQPGVVKLQPREDVGILQEPHYRPSGMACPSNSLKTSSGRGS